MRWFRDNVRHGAWFALFALAISLTLSFGHVHAIGGRSSEGGLIAAAFGLSGHGKAQGHSDDGQADDLCPICIVTGAIANALASAPPAILLQLKETVVERGIEPVRFMVALPRAPFQSRGPPLS
jgi:hypothetical protein